MEGCDYISKHRNTGVYYVLEEDKRKQKDGYKCGTEYKKIPMNMARNKCVRIWKRREMRMLV